MSFNPYGSIVISNWARFELRTVGMKSTSSTQYESSAVQDCTSWCAHPGLQPFKVQRCLAVFRLSGLKEAKGCAINLEIGGVGQYWAT